MLFLSRKARIASYEHLLASAREGPEAVVEFVIPCSTRLGDRAVRLAAVRKAYGDKVVLAGLDLELRPGDRLGIVGHNGAGKTTLLRICAGALAPDSGTAVIGPTVRFAQIDQTRSDLHDDKTVIEELGRVGDHVTIDGRPTRVETFLEQFSFTGARKHTLVVSLSVRPPRDHGAARRSGGAARGAARALDRAGRARVGAGAVVGSSRPVPTAPATRAALPR
ncbi:MAG: ATP-binding cassette domain-containing protein [Planctomycetota bacterium]